MRGTTMHDIRWLLVLLCALWLAACEPAASPTPPPTPPPTTLAAPSPTPTASPREPKLALLGWDWSPEGGLLRAYLRNEGPLPVRLSGLAAPAGQAASWSRVSPDPLPAGGVAAWTIRLDGAARAATLDWRPAMPRAEPATIPLAESPLAISYLTAAADGRRLLVFARNDSPTALIHLEEARLGGDPVPAEFRQRDLAPGEVALLALTPPVPPPLLGRAAVEVRGRTQDGAAVSAWGDIRPRAAFFPIGARPDPAELGEEALRALRGQGFNTVIVPLPEAQGDPFWTLLRDEEGLRAAAIPRYPADPAQLAAFADDPAILALVVEALGRPAAELEAAERAYQQATAHLTYLDLGAAELSADLAPLADAAGLARYAIDAPGPRWAGSHALEEVYTDTLALRALAGPGPVWTWAQGLGLAPWGAAEADTWGRLPTAAELRAQLWLQVAAGAKGVFWSAYSPALAAAAPELWAEIGRQNGVLAALGELLLYGEPAAPAWVEGGKALARPIVGERAAVIPVVNLDYAWERRAWAAGQPAPEPSPAYAFRAREGVAVQATLPAWLQAEDVFLVTPDGVAELEWSVEARVLTCRLAALEDAAVIVAAGDEALRDEVAARLR
ncbi:MAG: hypothetical protein GXY76_08210 [Chloroflexi bacterium]|nr:hypothetical protein [Chloroflexota bacterium]